MFGDPVTNPMGWTEHRLEEYIVFLTSGSRGWSKYFSDDGEIFITIKNVKNNEERKRRIKSLPFFFLPVSCK